MKIGKLVGVGVILFTLTGCANYGTSDTANKMAKKFLSDNLNVSTVFGDGIKLKQAKATYDSAEKKWDVQGTVEYQSEGNGYLWEDTSFEVVEHTNDNKMWHLDSIDTGN